MHRERPCDRDSLLLAAGQLLRIRVRSVAETDLVEQIICLLLRLFLCLALQLDRAERQVLENCHVREEIEMLEHHAHLLAVLVDVDILSHDVRALEIDMAGRRRLKQVVKQVERTEERRLAGAGRSDNDDDISLVNVHGHAVQRMDGLFILVVLAECLHKIDDMNQRHVFIFLISAHFLSASSQAFQEVLQESVPLPGK